MEEELKRLAIGLYRSKCILFGKFKLTSGLESPYYIDLRSVPSHPRLFKLMIKAYINVVTKLKCKVVAGVATAGLPIASVIAYKLGKPLVYVRREAKKHGTGRCVEGHFRRGWRAVVVDDVASTGGSILRAVEALRGQGLEVHDAVVLVDREQGAYERLKSIGVTLHSTFKISELARILYEENLLPQHKFKLIMDYLRGCKGGI